MALNLRSVPKILTDYRDLLALDIAAAIVALPNHLHARVSVDLLSSGIHLLVEKPMALSVAECDAMVKAAEAGRAVLAVGLPRRFLHAARFAKWAIRSGLLGKIVSFDIRDGYLFNWPLASDFFFKKETAGGGVLIDTGAHTLDQLLWWLGDVESFEYYDDNSGGVESDCELHIALKSGAQGIVELSRTRTLRNTAVIRGERAEIEVGLIKNTLRLTFTGSPLQVVGQGALSDGLAGTQQNQVDLMVAEHDDFLQAIRTGRPPEVDAAEASRCIEWIQKCYQERRALRLPWMTPSSEMAVG
jgi:predicted dehydrogenase